MQSLTFKILKIGIRFLPLIVLLVIPLAAHAEGLIPADLNRNTDIIIIVRAVIRFILIVAFVLAFIFLIIGGIRWITAGGDEKGVAGARGMITGALIGLVIVLVAYALIRLVETFFNVPILSETTEVPTILNSE